MRALVGSQLRRVDFYRRIPIDLTEPTLPGAIISILAGILMVSLLCGEIVSFFSPVTRSDMFVAHDDSHGAKFSLNLNMTFHKLPCFMTGVDVMDVLGHHEVGVSGTVSKSRVAPDGTTIIGEYREQTDTDHNAMVNEGCNLHGFLMLNKVPGNFHVSSHGLQHLVMQHKPGGIDVSHTIHELWVGEDVKFVGKHGYEGEVHPLNGMEQRDDQIMFYTYHMDLVPTIYAMGRNPTKQFEKGYQFTATTHKMRIPPSQMAAAYFHYSMSPITVRYSLERTPFIHFLTYVCAIIGGVFTVAGIMAGLFHTAAVQVQRRFLGKDQ